MATERLPLRHIREILRLKWRLNRSHRETARSLGISPGAVASVMSRASAVGLSWEALEGFTDEGLEQRLYGPKDVGRLARPLPDPAWIHSELRRVGVTLELLHLEYLQQHPDGYRYSAFCAHYRAWVERQRRSMRQVHRGGEKLFVDYSGKQPEVVDAPTGVVRSVQLFVAVLGASNYTYAEATDTQRSADFIQSHCRALEYLAGVPTLIIPDQLKTGVRQACRYEPVLQRT
jgi:transposase